jgi:hypothetical protein
LQARQEFHFDTLTSTVTPDSLAVGQVLTSVAQAAAQHGAPPAMAEQIAMQALNGLVQGQADVAAFDDLFLVRSKPLKAEDGLKGFPHSGLEFVHGRSRRSAARIALD